MILFTLRNKYPLSTFPRFTEKHGGWEWGGCSDNFQFGSQVAQQFLDGQETGADSNSLVNLHNNGAGRVVST